MRVVPSLLLLLAPPLSVHAQASYAAFAPDTIVQMPGGPRVVLLRAVARITSDLMRDGESRDVAEDIWELTPEAGGAARAGRSASLQAGSRPRSSLFTLKSAMRALEADDAKRRTGWGLLSRASLMHVFPRFTLGTCSPGN
jgi:hypothetical protein